MDLRETQSGDGGWWWSCDQVKETCDQQSHVIGNNDAYICGILNYRPGYATFYTTTKSFVLNTTPCVKQSFKELHVTLIKVHF